MSVALIAGTKILRAPKEMIITSTTSQKLAPLVLFFSLVSLVGPSWSQTVASPQLTFSISEREGSCDRIISLARGSRVTLTFPQDVRVSVPSYDQRLDLFINGRLVVVSAPVKAPRSSRPLKVQRERQSSGDYDPVSVTTELKSGEIFICRFLIIDQEDTSLHAPQVELIRVVSALSERRLEREAIKLIKARIKARVNAQLNGSNMSGGATPSSYESLDKTLRQWEVDIERKALTQLLGAQRLSISLPPPLRAQSNLIYVTIERVIVSDQRVYLRALIRNRSQEPFELQRVFYLPLSSRQPVIIWERAERDDHEDSPARSPNLISPPDAKEYPIALSTDRRVLESTALIFEGVDLRAIYLDLTEIDELE